MDYLTLIKERGEKLPDHLGDGLYASFDGYQIWLRAERDGRWHEVAIDQHVYEALVRYNKRVHESS